MISERNLGLNPLLNLAFKPANTSADQWNRFWELAHTNELVNCRSRQAGRTDHLFQTNDSQSAAPLLTLPLKYEAEDSLQSLLLAAHTADRLPDPGAYSP